MFDYHAQFIFLKREQNIHQVPDSVNIFIKIVWSIKVYYTAAKSTGFALVTSLALNF